MPRPAPSRRTLATVALLAASSASPLAAQSSTATSPPPVLGGNDAAIAGGFALGTLGAFALDRTLAERLQRPEVRGSRALSRTATVFRLASQPGVLVGLPVVYLVGRATKQDGMADVGLHGTEAVAVALVSTTIVKAIVGRARPAVDVHDPSNVALLRGITRGGEFQSFPSGHATTAFAAAAALTAETVRRHPDARWLVGVPAYGAASLVGWSRMFDNRHWASDVVAGAGFGTLAGVAVVRYQHTRPRNRVDRWFLGASIDGHGAVPMVFVR